MGCSKTMSQCNVSHVILSGMINIVAIFALRKPNLVSLEGNRHITIYLNLY